jgi:hypothetical protein
VEARGNIRVSLESRDGDDFHSFCQSVVRDAGEPHGETFRELDKVLGRCITVRFLTRAPGPPGQRNPAWLLMVRAVKLTLVGVQPRQLAGASPAAGSRMPFFGQVRMPETIGVFTADLSGGTPQQWTLQVAHVRYLLDLEVASGIYDMDTGSIKPMEIIASLFNFKFSSEGGGGASVLEYAATSALNIAQRSASWLTGKALKFTDQWTMRLDEDDTVSIATVAQFKIFGGFSTSVSMHFLSAKVSFSHGGLDVLYFFADPAQPLDGNLRATQIRVASAKTAGEFDVQRPFVCTYTWGGGNFHVCCKMVALDTVGKRVLEGVSQLLEKLTVSPGGGLLSDGSVTIRVGASDAQTSSSPNW